MPDSSRTQGTAICAVVVGLALWFLVGLFQQSYWALAIPVAIVVFFALGLSFWIGFTIATVQVEAETESETGDDPPASGTDVASDRPA